MTKNSVICLMGPTASGKTDIAIRLAKRIPVDVISVDSALVYRGMNIGTAKPAAETLARVPHRLIDIRDPEDSYSAGQFVRDAKAEILKIQESGRIPLLVGGTMMYFRSLTEGIAELPNADEEIRAAIDKEAAEKGWPLMHRQLAGIDPMAAERINRNDSQRIQRALEVYRSSGRSLTDWQSAARDYQPDFRFVKIGLRLESRPKLHQRIDQRLKSMFEQGFVEEVRGLMQRPGLSADDSSMRSVGYRQVWSHLAGNAGLEETMDKALFATRQLAKRQITWLRSEKVLFSVDPLEADCVDPILNHLRTEMAF